MLAKRYGYPAREPGTKSWLKNHRKMLRHMHSRAEEALAAAESALTEAESAYQRSCSSLNAAQLVLGQKQKRDKEENLNWQIKKRWNLDQNGIVLMDNGTAPYELGIVELQ